MSISVTQWQNDYYGWSYSSNNYNSELQNAINRAENTYGTASYI